VMLMRAALSLYLDYTVRTLSTGMTREEVEVEVEDEVGDGQ